VDDHERKNAQARALSAERGVHPASSFRRYGDSRAESDRRNVRFGEHGVQGICEMLRRKLGKEPQPQDNMDTNKSGTVDVGQFIEERKRFPETAVMPENFGQTSHWRIWICPTEFP